MKKNKSLYIPVKASYDAASRSSEATRHWTGADSLSADAALSPDIRKIIVRRARYEAANNGYCSGILNTLADDCIGTGPRLQLTVPTASEGALTDWEPILERRERRFQRWASRVNLFRKLKIARRSKAQDGEVFIRKFVNRKVGDIVQLDFEIYETEQVGSPIIAMTCEYWDTGVPKEVDGILFDQYGNPEQYRFWTVHPGALSRMGETASDSITVRAEDVIHYANIVRPGQHRGISEIASSLPVFNDLRRFTNAVLSAAETAAEISFVISTDLPADDNEEVITHLEPGTTLDFCRNAGVSLPEGWKASQLKAEQPTSTHADFVRTKIREAARPLSMPMNVALGDSSGYNYASGRLDHQTYFRTVASERRLIEDCILDNLLTDFESFDRLYYPDDYPDDTDVCHEWTWDGFSHVDPLKEANAQAVRLANRTATLADECSAEGRDWMQVVRQRAREEYTERQIRKQYGLPEVSEATQPQPTDYTDEEEGSESASE